jgi:hypothetical protein
MPGSELSQFRRAQQLGLDPFVRSRRRSGQHLASMRVGDLDRETLIAHRALEVTGTCVQGCSGVELANL